MARYNSVKLNAPVEEELHQIWFTLNQSANGVDKYDMRDLVRTPKLRKNCIVMFYLWYENLFLVTKRDLLFSPNWHKSTNFICA